MIARVLLPSAWAALQVQLTKTILPFMEYAIYDISREVQNLGEFQVMQDVLHPGLVQDLLTHRLMLGPPILNPAKPQKPTQYSRFRV